MYRWGKGPMISLLKISKGEEALQAFPFSIFSWGCFPRTHTSKTPSKKCMLDKPLTIPYLLSCCMYLQFRWPKISCQSLLSSSTWVNINVESYLEIKLENVYSRDWWFISPTTILEFPCMSYMVTKSSVNSTLFPVPKCANWLTESRFMEIFETCKNFSKLPFWSFTLPCPVTSTGVSSPMRMWGPMHVDKEDKTSYVTSMWWDAPESRIHASREEWIEIKSW